MCAHVFSPFLLLVWVSGSLVRPLSFTPIAHCCVGLPAVIVSLATKIFSFQHMDAFLFRLSLRTNPFPSLLGLPLLVDTEASLLLFACHIPAFPLYSWLGVIAAATVLGQRALKHRAHTSTPAAQKGRALVLVWGKKGDPTVRRTGRRDKENEEWGRQPGNKNRVREGITQRARSQEQNENVRKVKSTKDGAHIRTEKVKGERKPR